MPPLHILHSCYILSLFAQLHRVWPTLFPYLKPSKASFPGISQSLQTGLTNKIQDADLKVNFRGTANNSLITSMYHSIFGRHFYLKKKKITLYLEFSISDSMLYLFAKSLNCPSRDLLTYAHNKYHQLLS